MEALIADSSFSRLLMWVCSWFNCRLKLHSASLSWPSEASFYRKKRRKKKRCQVERAAFCPAGRSVARGLTHQPELGLQLDLERLKASLELVDLRPEGLETLCARLHLLVHSLKLGGTELRLDSPGHVFTQGQMKARASNARITFALYQLSMSLRFFSVMVSY